LFTGLFVGAMKATEAADAPEEQESGEKAEAEAKPDAEPVKVEP
jgi:hypothetical protein